MTNYYDENYIEQRKQEILDQIIECDATCIDLGGIKKRKEYRGIEKVDHYYNLLPGAGYVTSMLVNYIFSNGLTTGKTDDDKRLKAFLYRENEQGHTNYSVLMEAIESAIIYGECGIRLYRGNIYYTAPGTYGALTTRVNGIERVVAWFCTEDGKRLPTNHIDIEELIGLSEGERLIDVVERRFAENGLILLDAEEFKNIVNDPKEFHGKSPLLEDTLRLDLLITTYETLNKDLKYNGPGRIVLRPRAGYVDGEGGEISTAEVLNQSAVANRGKDKAAMEEAKKVAEMLKNSQPDSAIVVSNKFSEKIEKLEKVTKATEFFNWIENEGVIISELFGMPPSLIAKSKVSGNVSMEKIIDDAMLNQIVPTREVYATQFSPFISKLIGVDKIYFNKYELAQAEDVSTTLSKRADAILKLNSVDTDEAREVVADMLMQIKNSLHYDNGTGDLRELSVGMKEKPKGEKPNE